MDDKKYELTITKELGVLFKKGRRYFKEISTTGMILPMRFQIEQFLSRQNRLSEMIDNIRTFSLPSENITHYLQGSTWNTIRSYFNPEDIVIPIGIYTDGMQFN